MNNNRGQSLIMFALSVAALMAILISTVLIAISDMEKEMDRLKTRINSYQANIQIAQVVQTAWDMGVKDSTCTAYSGTDRIVVSGQVLCMPATLPCIFRRFCVSRIPGYEIAAIDSIQPEHLVLPEDEPSRGFQVMISLFSQASAQSELVSTRPVLPSHPPSNVAVPTCPDAAKRCVVCGGGAGANAHCFKIKVCTNFSTSCAGQDNSYEAQIGLVYTK